MSEDQMQGIPRWRPFRNLAGLAPDKNGEWVRYADASRALRKLRDALEKISKMRTIPPQEAIEIYQECLTAGVPEGAESAHGYQCGVFECAEIARAALREAK